MAGDWLKMRCDLAEDPAVIGIASKVNLDEFAVVGRLHSVWAWADRQSRDGHAPGVTHAFIDRKVQCDGFAQAMVDVGWLELGAGGVTFPNFGRHNGKTAKERALGATRQQKRRAESVTNVTDPAGQMSRSERDKGVTREEKRREEKEEKKPPDGGTVDPKELIWKTGLALLMRAGNSEATSRTFLGQYAKNGTETKLAEVIGHLAANPKIEPRAYITAAMTRKSGAQRFAEGHDA